MEWQLECFIYCCFGYICCWWFVITELNDFRSANHLPKLHQRSAVTENASIQFGQGSADKEELQNALQFLNKEKQKSLNLSKEDPKLLMQSVDASYGADRSSEIQKLVEERFDDYSLTIVKQYVALSEVNVYSVVTPDPEESSSSRNDNTEDVFKIVVQKNKGFKKTYVPRIRPNRRRDSSQTNPKRREVFHEMRDTNNPTRDTRRTTVFPINPTVIDYILKHLVYKHSIPSVSSAETQFFPRADEIGTRPSNRNIVLEKASPVNSKPNVLSQSPANASSTTYKNEKTRYKFDVDLDDAKIIVYLYAEVLFILCMFYCGRFRRFISSPI